MKSKKLVLVLLTGCIILVSGCSRIEESKDVSKTEQEQQTDSQQDAEEDDKTNQDNSEQADSDSISFHTYS